VKWLHVTTQHNTCLRGTKDVVSGEKSVMEVTSELLPGGKSSNPEVGSKKKATRHSKPANSWVEPLTSAEHELIFEMLRGT
jgi:hypothetical protein